MVCQLLHAYPAAQASPALQYLISSAAASRSMQPTCSWFFSLSSTFSLQDVAHTLIRIQSQARCAYPTMPIMVSVSMTMMGIAVAMLYGLTSMLRNRQRIALLHFPQGIE
ncbi:hypothetical protein BIFGAL_03318 [Bifidobacterium gallicum DSM 20093 = LMG 11596]|uniref:Uncharacterized protein n=1 Tax=Bifidobacterium gallicum DSM 20093 = LMG 11596 TaxID=561180 RepID=D1NTZ8_9BIFI|nr:hypothetical protein BIFGAL_03318 [Bifidobacterium gallicum DSM 20093 = LMG 11596]